MKKRLLKITIALCALFCCTACFDIQENLFLKKDGSGIFSFVVDMSQVKPMIAMFNDTDKDDNNDRKSNNKKNSANGKLNSTFEKTRRKLLNTEGISNVKIIDDTTRYLFGITFNFKNIDALNVGMNKLFEDDTATAKTNIIYFEYKDNQLTRLEALDSKSILGKSSSFTEKNTQENSENPLIKIDQLFGTVSYSTNYEFEDKVISSKNEQSMLSSNMQKVTLKVFPFATAKDSTKTKTSIGNTITFK